MPTHGQRYVFHSGASVVSNAAPQHTDWCDEVEFGVWLPNNDPSGGACFVRWYRSGTNGYPVPRLEVGCDGWDIIGHMPEVWSVFTRLATLNPSPQTVMEALRSVGFQDVTTYEWRQARERAA